MERKKSDSKIHKLIDMYKNSELIQFEVLPERNDFSNHSLFSEVKRVSEIVINKLDIQNQLTKQFYQNTFINDFFKVFSNFNQLENLSLLSNYFNSKNNLINTYSNNAIIELYSIHKYYYFEKGLEIDKLHKEISKLSKPRNETSKKQSRKIYLKAIVEVIKTECTLETAFFKVCYEKDCERTIVKRFYKWIQDNPGELDKLILEAIRKTKKGIFSTL